MEKTAKAFAPSGISSFFEACDIGSDGKPLQDLNSVGARGGGFGLRKGVLTAVNVSEADCNSVCVMINGRAASEAETTRTAVELILERVSGCYDVLVKHTVDVPIGAGFGTSAAGALTAVLALCKAFELSLTFNQLGSIAHVAEIRCRTGLGTVGPLMLGGCILTVEPGAPGVAVIDRIPISGDYVIVAGVYGPTPTKNILTSPERREAVNKCGRKTLDRILKEPSLENFLACCYDFAEETGFMTDKLRLLVKLARKAGAVGAAQNMVGEAVHALATPENAEDVFRAFRKALPESRIIVSEVDVQGARLLG